MHRKSRASNRAARSSLTVVLFPLVAVLPFVMVIVLQGQSSPSDPGVRGGPAAAGGPIPGLTTAENSFFLVGKETFEELDTVNGAGGTSKGLGPRFNLDGCAGCHAQPAVGGTSPSPSSPQVPLANPQVAMASKNGATNTVPFFITATGPVREARFKFTAGGSRDGGVHDLFTIKGRSDAPGCNIAQPDFDAEAANNNLIFRIPTPLFGAGLIEAIQDSTILANRIANGDEKRALGIHGKANTNGNDGTITRVGWKAQNKSLELFSGEAYNVEQGVTNEIFQNERDETPGCLFNGIPEDHTNFGVTLANDMPSDVVKFAVFMRFLAPPTPAADTPSIANGRALFTSTGCAFCHTPTLMTGLASSAALSNKQVNLFSDLLVHKMGPGLADDIAQGHAGPDQFRTAPLWGLGQRIFFLHDGRTTDLLQAIQAHASAGHDQFVASEANAVVANFNSLTPSQRQDVLNFLRSL